MFAKESGHAQSVFWTRDSCQIEKFGFEFEPMRNLFEQPFAESVRNE